MRRNARPYIAAAALLSLLLSACSGGDGESTEASPLSDTDSADADDSEPEEDEADSGSDTDEEPAGSDGEGDGDGEDNSDSSEQEEPDEAQGADPAEVGANELGLVPVLMYHRLVDDGGSVYDSSPEEFVAELERLYEEDYRPVRLKDMVRGQIDVPAGTTPVVLTFDDSTRDQAALDDDGDIAADTSMGILIEFAEDKPDFDPVASLYVNAGPFGGGSDSDDILRRLHELGFEIGNHTSGHARLDNLDSEGVQRELALGKDLIVEVVEEAEVVTLSLPFGIWADPRDPVYEGEWEGTTYENEGVLLVGAEPAPSPFNSDFDPLAIPRIRSGVWDGGEPDYASGFWLDWLADNSERRYVSDGNPNTISFPEELQDRLAPEHADRANPYEPTG